MKEIIIKVVVGECVVLFVAYDCQSTTTIVIGNIKESLAIGAA